MSGEETFSRRTVAWLVAVGAVSLGLSVFSVVFLDKGGAGPSAGSDSFSYSALGHRAFVRLLEEAGIPVVVSRSDSADRAREDSVLVLAEPPVDEERLNEVGTWMRSHPGPILLVLPKREGRASSERDGWVAATRLLEIGDVTRVLQACGIQGGVVRPPTSSVRADALFRPHLADPQVIVNGRGEIAFADQGALVLAPSSNRLILADPDLIANHGIHRGENAAIALDLVERLRGGTGAVVIDETIHGFETTPSIWREVLRFPVWPAVVHALFVSLLVGWAAMVRFGAAAPLSVAIEPGKEVLIENTARLLRSGGRAREVAKRYFEHTIIDVANRLHAPATLKREIVVAWLAERSRARGIDVDLAAIGERMGERSHDGRRGSILSPARRLFAWKKAMVHGTHDDTKRRDATA